MKRNGEDSAARAQDDFYHGSFDYDVSPHIRHDSLRRMLVDSIVEVVGNPLGGDRPYKVLEIGAGHGNFTEIALQAGAQVTVTEMSAARCDYLADRFRSNSNVSIVHDPDGTAAAALDTKFDAVLLISVIHHIPDYLSSIASLCNTVVAEGGSLLTFQDPLWYPRMTKFSHYVSEALYLTWRLGRGNYRQGISTRLRRVRGVYDEQMASDMVEYHVVRDGVDEEALTRVLNQYFLQVDLKRYFSTPLPLAQRIGEKMLPANSFAIVATKFGMNQLD